MSRGTSVAYTKLDNGHGDENSKIVVDSEKGYDYTYIKPVKVAVVHENGKQPCNCKRSWLKITLYVLLALIGLTILLAVIVGTWGFLWTRHQVKRFTVTQPHHYQIYQLPDAEVDVIVDKGKLFVDSLRANKVPEQDYTVTVDELNAMIAKSDYLRGNAFVTVHENELLFEMSLPTRGLPGGKGRYFVATATLNVVPDEDNDQRAVVTTQLETEHAVRDVDGALWLTQVLVFRDAPKQYPRGTTTLVAQLQQGKFLNWIVPADYINKHENLIAYLLQDEESEHGCHHQHGHDWNEDGSLANLLEGLQAVTLSEDGKVTFHAKRPNLEVEGEQDEDDFEEKEVEDDTIVNSEPFTDGRLTSFGGGTRKLLKTFFF